MTIERWEMLLSSKADRYMLKIRGDRADVDRIVQAHQRVCHEPQPISDAVYQWVIFVVDAGLNERLSIQNQILSMVRPAAGRPEPKEMSSDLSSVLSELSSVLEELNDLTAEEEAQVFRKMQQIREREARDRAAGRSFGSAAAPTAPPMASSPPPPPPARSPLEVMIDESLIAIPEPPAPPAPPPAPPPRPVARPVEAAPASAAPPVPPAAPPPPPPAPVPIVAAPPPAPVPPPSPLEPPAEPPAKTSEPFVSSPVFEIEHIALPPPAPPPPPVLTPPPAIEIGALQEPAAPSVPTPEPPPPPAVPAGEPAPASPAASPPPAEKLDDFLPPPPASGEPMIFSPEEIGVPEDQILRAAFFYPEGADAALKKFTRSLTEIAQKKAKKPMLVRPVLTQVTTVSLDASTEWIWSAKSAGADCFFVILPPDVLPDFMETAASEARSSGVTCFLIPEGEIGSRLIYVDLMVEMMLIKRRK